MCGRTNRGPVQGRARADPDGAYDSETGTVLDVSASSPVNDPVRSAAVDLPLPRRPVLTFWLIAVALEILLGVAFLLSGAESAIDRGLSRAGIDFGSDLLTAVRVIVVYPAALLGVL